MVAKRYSQTLDTSMKVCTHLCGIKKNTNKLDCDQIKITTARKPPLIGLNPTNGILNADLT